MIYIEGSSGETMLITGGYDSTIKVYDVGDDNQILRIMTGGHLDHEITALAYSE